MGIGTLSYHANSNYLLHINNKYNSVESIEMSRG